MKYTLLKVTGVIFLLMNVFVTACKSDVTMGSYTVTDVYVTNKAGEDGQPLRSEIPDKFNATQTIFGVIQTTGADGILGVRWYKDDQLIYENFARTENNLLVGWIQASPIRPILPGEYRFEAIIPPDTVKKAIKFTVKEYVPDVIPPQPTPVGHMDLENSPYIEVPFAFDETWSIEGQDWLINEVKIVFLRDVVLLAVVVIVEQDIPSMSETEIDKIAKPIAEYAVAKNYLEKAENIKINGTQFKLPKNLTVTLFNPNTRRGHRQQYDLAELVGH